MSLSEFKDSMLPAIETELKNCVQIVQQDGLIELHHMLSYHLGWEVESAGNKAQGKRVRPLLLLLTTSAASGIWENALPAAAAVELVHNFSLIHDDIQDNSNLRRGRRTVWKKWGIAQALNAGDSMFALAHIALRRLEELVPIDIALKAQHILPKACLTLTQGQYLDLSYEDRKDLSVEDYWPMIKGKTAALLAACTELGALLAGVKEDIVKSYRSFGEFIGLAFQVQDDILGIWGDITLTGKSVESDLLAGKKSLPVLFALEQGKDFAKKWENGNINPKDVPELVVLLENEGAYDYAKRKVDKLTKQALGYLEEANPIGSSAIALKELVNKLVHRSQ